MSSLEAPAKIKSFWDRREGKVGKGLVAALLGAAGLVVWYKILPFLLTIVWGTTQLVIGGIVLFILAQLILNKRIQTLASFAIQLVSRALTSIFWAIDPEGILREYVKDRERKMRRAVEQTENLKAVISRFESRIRTNEREAVEEMDRASAAKRRFESGNLPEEQRRRMQLAFSNAASRAGMLRDTNKKLSVLLEQMKRYYAIMLRINDAAEFVITYTKNQVEQLIMQREGVNEAFGAMKQVRAIIKGDDKTEFYDETVEMLLADAERKLGQIDGFVDSATGFLARVDLEKGRFEESALRELEAYGQQVDAIIHDQVLHSGVSISPMDIGQSYVKTHGTVRSIADLIDLGGSDKQ